MTTGSLQDFGALAGISQQQEKLEQQKRPIPSYDTLQNRIEDLERSNDFKDAVIDSYVALVEKQMSLIRTLSERIKRG